MEQYFRPDDLDSINKKFGGKYQTVSMLITDLLVNADNEKYIGEILQLIKDNPNIDLIIDKIVLANSKVKEANWKISLIENREGPDSRNTKEYKDALIEFYRIKELKIGKIFFGLLNPSTASYKYLKYKQKYLQLVNISKGVNLNHKLMY
jgi:hypothetical protein